MKSAIFTWASLFFCLVAAQPHRAHQKMHQKRDIDVVMVTDWVVVTETAELVATVIVDPSGSTITEIMPTITPAAPVPAEFFQPAPPESSTPTTSSTSAVIPAPSSPAPPSPPEVQVAAAVPPSSASSTASVFVPPPPPPPPPAAPTTPTPSVAPQPTTPVAAPPPSTPSSAPVVDSPVVAAAVPPTTSQEASAAAPTSAAPPAPASSSSPPSSGSSGLGGCSQDSPCTGELTYYEAGLGACGITNDGDTDMVVAVPVGLMGSASNNSPICGMKAFITVGSKSITATCTDKCPSCADNHLDLSNAAFLGLGLDLAQGVAQASWYFGPA